MIRPGLAIALLAACAVNHGAGGRERSAEPTARHDEAAPAGARVAGRRAAPAAASADPSGASSAPPAAGSRPRVELPSPTIARGIATATVERVVSRSSAALLACYDESLAVAPALEGQVTVSFAIAADGAALQPSASSELRHEALVTCVITVFARMSFPRPARQVDVTYPVVFRRD